MDPENEIAFRGIIRLDLPVRLVKFVTFDRPWNTL